MEDKRACENCKHFIIRDSWGVVICGCEKWVCKFESKEGEEEKMTNSSEFPNSIYEFLLDNSFKDTDEVYTNGSLLIPTFRVKQAIEHYYPCEDAISREAVKYYIQAHIHEIISESGVDKNAHTNRVLRMIINGIETMPSIGYKESKADDK